MARILLLPVRDAIRNSLFLSFQNPESASRKTTNADRENLILRKMNSNRPDLTVFLTILAASLPPERKIEIQARRGL
jgi:hypothetical protein